MAAPFPSASPSNKDSSSFRSSQRDPPWTLYSTTVLAESVSTLVFSVVVLNQLFVFNGLIADMDGSGRRRRNVP